MSLAWESALYRYTKPLTIGKDMHKYIIERFWRPKNERLEKINKGGRIYHSYAGSGTKTIKREGGKTD